MRSKDKERSHVRSFEREARIQGLLEAGIISSATEIPDDAIPAAVEFAHGSRPPFYRDMEFRCADCGTQSVWLAEDQRHWYEQLHGSQYSTAKRCRDCRRKKRAGK